MDMREIVKDNPILAIMRKIPVDLTLPYARAVYDGGVRFFEVALNSPDGIEQIAMLSEYFGDRALIGAGTAINADLAQDAVDAGAMFLLAPSSPVEVLEYCAEQDIPFLPGVLTPTDVGLCVDYGFFTLKMFPAGDLPMGYVKSLKGPFDYTDYVAIGGVTPDNIPDFIKAGYIGVGLGSNLFPKEFMMNGEWGKASDFIAGMMERAKNAISN